MAKSNIIFLLILWFGMFGRAQNMDVKLLKQIHVSHSTEADYPFRFLSNSTTAISVAIPASMMGLGWIYKDSSMKRNALVVAAAYAIAGSVTFSLKYLVNRPRPFEAYPHFFLKKSDAGSPSFPSGHTSMAFSAATSLSLTYPKWYIIVPSYIWAGSVAYSRMHLGVHYPSDVLMGAFIGSASAYLSYKANQWLHKKYNY